MSFVGGLEQPKVDFRANSAELEASKLNYKNGSHNFRLTLILRQKFANYCVFGLQLSTVACLIHAEARLRTDVLLQLCNLLGFFLDN
jgi:hypothetical protein